MNRDKRDCKFKPFHVEIFIQFILKSIWHRFILPLPTEWVCTARPKMGVFSYFPKYKGQRWFLYEVIEDVMPFVLNTKRPLSDIWLLSCGRRSFGCFLKNN